MATLEEYKGSIDLISGLRAKNNGKFPLMEAHDILVGADDLRLDEKLANMGEGGGAYILELSGENGPLTDEQYNAVVANAPNVSAIIDGIMCTYDGNDGSGYYFKSLNLVDTEGEEDSATFFSVYVTVSTDKTFSTVLQQPELATKTYVDNAVANAGSSVELDTTLTQEGKAADAKAVGDRFGTYVDEVDALLGDGTGSGGGSSGGLSIKSITFTDRPTAWEWVKVNFQKVLKTFLTYSQSPTPICYNSVNAGFNDNETSVVTFFSIIPTNYTEDSMSLYNLYFAIEPTGIRILMNGKAVYFENGTVTVTNDALTYLPDEHWSAMSAQLTCYYIE